LSRAYLLLNAASYDGENLHADAHRPRPGHVLVFMSIRVVVTKIVTFFPKRVQIGLDFCCGQSPQAADRSVGPYYWLAVAARCAAKSSLAAQRAATACHFIFFSRRRFPLSEKIQKHTLSVSLFCFLTTSHQCDLIPLGP